MPYRGQLAYNLQDLLRRNGMQAQLAIEGDHYKLLVQGHDSPLLSYNISEQQFRALTDGGTNFSNKKAYATFNAIVGKDFDLPSSSVAALWDSMAYVKVATMVWGCRCIPMPSVTVSSDGHHGSSQASTCVASMMYP